MLAYLFGHYHQFSRRIRELEFQVAEEKRISTFWKQEAERLESRTKGVRTDAIVLLRNALAVLEDRG